MSKGGARHQRILTKTRQHERRVRAMLLFVAGVVGFVLGYTVGAWTSAW